MKTTNPSKENIKKFQTYVDAVAKAVIQAWNSPHQNLKGFFRMKKK